MSTTAFCVEVVSFRDNPAQVVTRSVSEAMRRYRRFSQSGKFAVGRGMETKRAAHENADGSILF